MLGITVLAAIIACGKLGSGDKLHPVDCKIKLALGCPLLPKKGTLGSCVGSVTDSLASSKLVGAGEGKNSL